MVKCTINLENTLEEDVKSCVKNAEIGSSPTGTKLYVCSSKILKHNVKNSNKNKFIELIIKKLSCLKNVNTCEIEISIGASATQKQQRK